MRLLFIIISSTLFGLLFWQQGTKIENVQDLFNIMGSVSVAMIFVGGNNCATIIPVIARERAVLSRERFAGMYSSRAYSFAQVAIEIPYTFLLTVTYVIITYPMIGYYWSTYKVFWYFYAIFCTLFSFNYFGMLIISLSPNIPMASILTSACYTVLTLFSGFIIPRPRIPRWWIWLYWICPTSWSLNGLVTSQYGDITKEIPTFGGSKPINTFLREYHGFHHDQLGLVAFAITCFPVIFAFLFSYFIGKINFYKR